jgi:integrase
MQPLLKPEQVADLLQLSLSTIYAEVDRLGGFYPAGIKRLRFRQEVIDAIMEGPRSGKYRCQFQYLGCRYSKTGFNTIKAAEKWKVERQTELEKEAQNPPSPKTPSASVSEVLTLETLMVKYLRLAEKGLAEKTIYYRKTVFRRFLAHLGDIPVLSLTPEQVEEYLPTRPSNHNFNKERTEIMRLFSWAHRRQLVPQNPVFLVEKLTVTKQKKVIPTPQDMAKILMAAGPDRPLLLILFHTMARIDEILRLKWEDVNFEQKAVRLWTRKRRGGNWEFDWMMMNEDLHEVLWSLWQKREQGEYVFFNVLTGTRYLYRPKLMGTICKRAGVPKFGFHTIRHFVASYLFDNKKVSMPVISKLLRHKSLQTTERYLQAIDPRFRDTMRLLEGNVLGVLKESEVAEG